MPRDGLYSFYAWALSRRWRWWFVISLVLIPFGFAGGVGGICNDLDPLSSRLECGFIGALGIWLGWTLLCVGLWWQSRSEEE
jgi:hypothetical protein